MTNLFYKRACTLTYGKQHGVSTIINKEVV